MSPRSALVAFALAALVLVAAPAVAEEREGWSYRLAHEVMSPFCPGQKLAECPSPNASALREWIIDQERAGVSKAEVERQLLARWGDQLLQAPRAEGFGLFAYAVPIGAMLAGGVLVALALGGRRDEDTAEVDAPAVPEPVRATAAPSGPVDDDDLARIIDEAIAE